MRVWAFMKYDRMAASTRQRLLQFAPYLARHGVEIEFMPLLDNRQMVRIAQGRKSSVAGVLTGYPRRIASILRVLLAGSPGDVMWVHKELFPYLPLEALAGLARSPLIVDYDDATYHTYDQNPRGAVRALLGSKLKPLLRRATLCIAGNDYLADYARRYCRDTVVIPTVLDTDIWKPAPKAEGGPVVIGWIGSPSTWHYVVPILPQLQAVVERHGAQFRVVGAGPAARRFGWIDLRDWSEATELADVQGMDIGIMPLPATPWAEGKCGYKLIQYMACGLPVVASPVGVNSQIVDEGRSGLFAREDWTQPLERLIEDAGKRAAMGRQGRETIVARYSLASQEPRLLEAIRRASARS